jgi:CubicO group peptidase (beta-lactamase class C family)
MKKKSGIVIAAVAVAAVIAALALYRHGAGRGGARVVVQLVPQPDQPRVSPEEAGIDAAALHEAVTYAAERNTRALVVAHGGHIAFEKYWGDTRFDSPVETGFEPVLLALAMGTALNDRLVHNLDEPLSNYIEEARAPQRDYTLRALLARDDASLEDATDLLAWVLERVTAQPYQTLVAQRLWMPMGGGSLEFHQGAGRFRRQGVSAACCLRARLGDWMRVGELLANRGVFEGNQLMPPHYADLVLKPSHRQASRGYFTRVDGAFASADVAWLEGSGKQRLWIVPSLRLAILRLGDEPPSQKGWDEALIPDAVIRGTRGWQPAGAGAGAGVDPNRFAPH